MRRFGRAGGRIAAGLLVALFAISPTGAEPADRRAPIPSATADGTIAGHVRTASNAPIPGAIVTMSGPSSVTVTTDSSGFYTSLVSTGTYTLTIDASDYLPATANAAVVHDATTILDFALTAVVYTSATYDPTLKVPVCGQGSGCDSAALLLGRDTITGGPEPHQPNTLDGCADSSVGTFHGSVASESIDRIKIWTVSGRPFAPGETVRIDVTVWAVADVVANVLRLYSAANASSPSWTQLFVTDVQTPGAHTISASFVLAAGADQQAVRAVFHGTGPVGPGYCVHEVDGAGGYDHDDLVFAAPIQPTVATGAASIVRPTGARLNANVNPNGVLTSVAFQYGLTTSYGSVSAAQSVGSGTSAAGVSAHVSGLVCHTLYHFRAVATNANVSATGADSTFTTGSCDFWTQTLVWHNAATGENLVWLMNGSAIGASAALPTIADPHWAIKGVADLDGDGHADIIWRNTATGQNIVWFLNGTTLANALFMGDVADPDWDIQAVRDFNGDGKADILWRNAATGQLLIWLMNGTGLIGWGFLPSVTDPSWQLAGVGDLNGDGKADLVWRNSVSGQNVGWLLDGTTLLWASFFSPVADLSWEIRGVQDFDGDGQADILWHNVQTGESLVWLMKGVGLSSFGFLPTASDTTWEVAAATDVDGDGETDLVWRNRASGVNTLWQMDALVIRNAAFLATIADPNWKLIVR